MSIPVSPNRSARPVKVRRESLSSGRPHHRSSRSAARVSRPYSLSSLTPPPSSLITRPHHHESHEAAFARILPAVPIAELDDDITRLHDVLAIVEQQDALAFEQHTVVD